MSAESFLLFGGLGGIAYVLRQHVKGYRVRKIEYLARPVFGALAAFLLTVSLSLPNHTTSLFAGYFGIDIWDAALSRFEATRPFAFKHEPKPPAPR